MPVGVATVAVGLMPSIGVVRGAQSVARYAASAACSAQMGRELKEEEVDSGPHSAQEDWLTGPTRR